ncbi:MAG: paraquat-inducible protein A [Pseudomonadota bacterium]
MSVASSHAGQQAPTARSHALVGCTTCTAACAPELARCPRCGAPLASRPAHGLQPVWAWLAAGAMFYIPANAWPMLRTTTLFQEQEATILGGAIELAETGSWGVAAIVFIASIAIPIAKFGAIAFLALAVRYELPQGLRLGPSQLVRLYEVVEFIGRWSMIDIFVVAVLAALVQLGFLASLAPGPAAGCFAASVAFTMLAARRFDPRLLWDRLGHAA